jgi:NAD(P)-dependent dehydrogenase (short-subunit alcohol dehydrogenase family)
VLVSNVGTNRRKQVLEYSKDDFSFLMDTNVHSALQLSQLCQPLLAASGSSCIIFNSSVAGGPLAMKSGCIYAMTKGKVRAPRWGGVRLTKHLPVVSGMRVTVGQHILSAPDKLIAPR